MQELKRINKKRQYLFSILLILLVSAVCYGLSAYMGYRVVALILLLTVSLIAITFDILPVLVAAALSAFIWDFFFIPPRFTIHVANTEDSILLIMYFIIAMVNAVLTYKVRQVEKIARQKEEKANAVKLYNTLLNSLSHELRTPIATIIGATDNLQANNNNLTAENKAQLVTEISKASLRLNQQVENLLNMSRIESGFLKPKNDWCDIREFVYDVVKRIEENKVSQEIIININQNIPLFNSDKGMLEQILYNLLNNAILYSDSSSTIKVSVTSNTDSMQFIIEDNGKGFPPDEIDYVFDKFYRLKNSKLNGTGLGLSIVKGFTEALGGTVNLRNNSTGGARFSIEIPGETLPVKIGK
jgi:two-component system, OmpR family, sensor histidine kinase KdpD